MTFQTQVNPVQAPGVAGEFCDTNPRRSVTGGPGGLICGPQGVACGYFGWVDPATGSVVTNYGAGKPSGFVKNSHQALITEYLGQSSLVVPAGFMMGDLFSGGGFWIQNNTGMAVIPGQKVYANNSTGAASSFAAAGTPTTAGTSTASTIAAGTASVEASIAIPTAGNTVGPGTVPAIMTVTTVNSGVLYPGSLLSGSGVATGTRIVAQLSGAVGGLGTYSVSIAQAVASTTVTTTYGLLTIGGTVVSGFAVGQTLGGSANPSAGTAITALGTGVGGAGTYIVNNTQTVGSGQITSFIGTETDWTTQSFGNGTLGEIIKISAPV